VISVIFFSLKILDKKTYDTHKLFSQ